MGESGGLRRIEEEVGEVCVSGVGFQFCGDGVGEAFCLFQDGFPLLQATAVGKEREATSTQAFQFFGRQAAAATGGEPKHIRITGSHDEGSLLTFDDADMGLFAKRQEVLAEEALVKLEVERKQSLANHAGVSPTLETLSVSVGTISHDVSGMYLLTFVNLPEDDITLTGGTYIVVIKDSL